MYNINDLLTMSDGVKYIVTSAAIYESKNYYLLINYDITYDWVIVYESNGDLEEEINTENLDKIFKLFSKDEKTMGTFNKYLNKKTNEFS